jgi:TetR/AcrR family fatty acid metabolism transcriptional regulator
MARKDRRAEIMQAAERLFTSRRFHEVTLDDVAQGAHVGKGTIYRYFADKDDLFFQTATHGFDELIALLGENVPARAPFPEKLLSACRLISEFFSRRRELFRLMQNEEGRVQWCRGPIRQRWMECRKGLVGAVAEVIRSGVTEEQVRADVPPEVLANFLLGLLRARARGLPDGPEDWRRLELVVEFFCHGADVPVAHSRRNPTV